jgi:4-hydroxybenzoate polyprenyltransferase
VLTLAMAGFQAAIGAVNDLRDLASDAVGQPWKPLPSGRLSTRAARRTAIVGGGIGVVGSAALGLSVLVVGLAGFGLGLAYDLRLKRTPWGWLCFAIALPLIPVFAWLGVGAGAPPELGMLFLLGGLAGLELGLANGLVDEGTDRRAGAHSLAVRLGPRLARVTMAGAAMGIIVVAWRSLLDGGGSQDLAATTPIRVVLALGSMVLVVGVALAMRRDPAWSWRGWQVQAVGVAMLGLAWLAVSVQAGTAARGARDGDARPVGRSALAVDRARSHQGDGVLQLELGDGQVLGQVAAIHLPELVECLG